MTSSEFRQLLYSLSGRERAILADRLQVTARTIQRWSTYAGQQRDALRSRPELRHLTENEVLMGLRGAYAIVLGVANKGIGEFEEEYCFDDWGTACRFAWSVVLAETDNLFLNMACVSVIVEKLDEDSYCCTMQYEASYSSATGWADKIWYWYGTGEQIEF